MSSPHVISHASQNNRLTVATRGFSEVDALLDGIAVRARAPRPWLHDAADRMEQLMGQAFTDEGPGWPALRPSTQQDRRRKGYGPAGPILQRRRVLYGSTQKGSRLHVRRLKGTRSIEVGSRDPRAFFHEFGTARMRARPFAVVTLADAAVFRITAADYVMGRWARRAATNTGTGRVA